MRRMIYLVALLCALILNAGAETIFVDIQDFSFSPRVLYVPLGTTVTWTNYGPSNHTATADGGMFNSGVLTPGQSFSFTFNTEGDIAYHCAIHPFMTATIHARTSANLPGTLTITPTSPPIVIEPSGGNFQYHARGTNQTMSEMNIQYWTKMYKPDNTFAQTYLQSVQVPANNTRQNDFTQDVPGTAPAGTYHYFAYAGTNPDSVIAWSVLTFSKSGFAAGSKSLGAVDADGWTCRELGDWYHLTPGDLTPKATSSAMEKLKAMNSPEPFNPSTVISYYLPTNGLVTLEVFNTAGQRVATLINRVENAGDHQVTFEASRLPSGLYLYRLDFAGQSLINKMMLVK